MEPAGARLKKIRLEKGLNLEEAQKKTKIHPNILKAIEGDTITGLSPIYLKGFLKIYCKFLGVDPKDYIPDYKETQQPALKDITREGRGPNKKIIATFISGLIIIILAIGLFNLGKAFTLRRSINLARRPAMVLSPRIQNKKIAQPKLTAAVPKTQIASSVTLGIRAKENCFVDLKADGRTVFHGVLSKGRSEVWKAKEKMELYLSSAGAVELQVNEQHFANLGRRGQVIKGIVITREGLKIPR